MDRLEIPHFAKKLLTVSAVALSLAACATYEPAPLPVKPDLLDHLPLQQPGPVDMDQIATIAVINNPDLRSARYKDGVADAQAFEAGILPNPQLAAGLNFPTNQQPGPNSDCQPHCPLPGTGWNFGLTYDLQ